MGSINGTDYETRVIYKRFNVDYVLSSVIEEVNSEKYSLNLT